MGGAETSASGPQRERSSPLRVYLLGRFEVERDGSPIPADAWRRRRPAELLKLLALAPGRALGREAAVAALWPGMPPAQGASNLHRALYDLRQVLGARWVDLEGGEVRLRQDAWIDVDAFEAGARSADPVEQERALSLYEGDLSALDGAPPWAQERREAIRDRFASASLEVARALADGGAAERAIAILRRALGSGERGGDEAHVLLVRLLATGGRRAEALRHLDRYESRQRSTGRALADRLDALRDAILSGEVAPLLSGRPDGYVRAARRLLGTSAPPPLRGREATSPLLRALVEAGWGSVVLLGEQGVGKTRLAVEGARLAHEAGAVVLTGAFDPTRPQPCLPFAEMFEEHRRAGGSHADPFSLPEGCAHDKPTLYRRVREALRAIGAGRPLYLLVDELEHADESSANLFHHLARSAQELRLMLVATCREEAVRAGAPVQMLLAHLASEQLSRGVRLPRLGLKGSTELVGDLLGSAPAELAMLFYRLTDGRPHFIEALARAYRDGGSVPGDPAAAIREVLGRLRPDTARLLEAAAVAGRRFDLAVARAASGLGGRDLLDALQDAVAAGVLSFDGEHHHVRDALVRDAVYARVPDAERAALHAAVADALSARAAASDGGVAAISEQLAHHRRLAGDAQRAFGHLVEAGRRAAARAGLGEAKAFYTAALELAAPAGAPPDEVCELLTLLGEVSLALAELPDAGRAFEAAARLDGTGAGAPGAEAIARARHGAALTLVVGGRLEEAERELQRLVAQPGLEPGARRAQAHLLLARIPLHQGRFTEALERAEIAVAQAELAGDRALAVLARDVESLAAAARGARARPAWPLPIPLQEQPFDTRLVLFELDLVGDRTVAELEALVAAWGDVVRGRDVPTTHLALPRAMHGALAARAARRREALPALREAARLFEEAGCALGLTFALERQAALLTAGGRLDEAMRLLGGAIVAAEQAPLRRHALTRAHAALVRNRLAAGDLDAAEDVAREASEYAGRHGACVVCHAQLLPELSRLALAQGRLAHADDRAAELDGLAARRGGRGLRAVARELRGRVLAAHGAHAEAAVAFCDAADLFDAAGAALRAAQGRELASRALREAGGADRLAQADALAARASAVLAPVRAADGA